MSKVWSLASVSKKSKQFSIEKRDSMTKKKKNYTMVRLVLDTIFIPLSTVLTSAAFLFRSDGSAYRYIYLFLFDFAIFFLIYDNMSVCKDTFIHAKR